MEQIRRVAGDYDRRHDPHGHCAGDAQLPASAAVGHAAGATSSASTSDTHAEVSDFGNFLQHPENREHLSFELHEDGYDIADHQAGGKARRARKWNRPAGNIGNGRAAAGLARPACSAAPPLTGESRSQTGRSADASEPASADPPVSPQPPSRSAEAAGDEALPAPPAEAIAATASRRESGGCKPSPARRTIPSHASGTDEEVFDPATATAYRRGAGHRAGQLSWTRRRGPVSGAARRRRAAHVPTAGQPPKATSDTFTIVDFYESKMSEYDSGFVFVPLEKLQAAARA